MSNHQNPNREYCPGRGCQCFAHYPGECVCPGVDWTPVEVYQLRLKVEELENELASMRKTRMHFEDLSG